MENFSFQYLKHGKALCRKVFGGFVETFNFHNDFIRNLRGDADGNGNAGGNGRITLDTSDPRHPVIRFRNDEAAKGKGSSGGAQAYWTYTQADDGEGETVGIWANCVAQIGYRAGIRLNGGTGTFTLSGSEAGDGYYYAKFTGQGESCEIVKKQPGSFDPIDLVNDAVYVYIGRVEEGVQTDGIYSIPVVYRYA